SHHPVIVCASRIGGGSLLFGGTTLGVGGPRDARGIPTLGARVVLGPGTSCSGPIDIPEDSVLGANTVAIRTLPQPGRGWAGAPATLYGGPREALIPRIEGGAA